MRKHLRTIYALAIMNGVKPILRSPLWLVVELSFPLTIIFFIYLFASEAAVSEALIGGAISIMTLTGLALQSDVVWLRVELKFQDVAVASPASPIGYMIGVALSELAYSSPAVALLLSLMALRGLITLTSAPMIVLSLTLSWLSALSLGFYLSTRVTDLRHIWAMSSLISILLSMLPPVFYPIHLLPPWAQAVSLAAPTTHAALLAKEAAGLTALTSQQRALSLLTLLAWTTALTLIAVKKSAWREA